MAKESGEGDTRQLMFGAQVDDQEFDGYCNKANQSLALCDATYAFSTCV